jgi:hypothetical protein
MEVNYDPTVERRCDVRLRVLVVQTFGLPETLTDAELDKAQDEIRAGKREPDSVEWLAHRIETGPVTLVAERSALLPWFSARTGGR